MHMSRTTVTRIIRIVFLIWLILTAGLVWQIARRFARSANERRIGGSVHTTKLVHRRLPTIAVVVAGKEQQVRYRTVKDADGAGNSSIAA
jgi:hypothetical protein